MFNDLLEKTLKDLLKTSNENIDIKYKFVHFYQNKFQNIIHQYKRTLKIS